MEEEIKTKVCTKCGRELPITHEYFYYDKYHKDGFLNICRECKGGNFIKTPKDGFKICTKCGKELPATTKYFHQDKSTKDGLFTYCKDCAMGRNIENFDIEEWYFNKSEIFKGNWSLDDIKWLYNNYFELEKKDILKYFKNKNYKTITNVVYQWNLKKKEKNDNWSNEDIDFLIENYSNMSQTELQDRFKNRTWDGIKNKASKLNLCRDDETLYKIKSDCHKGIKVSEETKRKMSRSRRGSKSVNWKGGLTPLIPYFRSILYEWKLDSLKQYNFKCSLTNTNKNDLEIHHVYENFSNLVYKTLDILNLPVYENMFSYEEHDLKLINETFLKLHYESGLGIPLKKNLHRLFHTIYGLTNNTPEQFEEFKQRYYNGEFDETLKSSVNNVIKKKKIHRRLQANEVIEIRKLLNQGFTTEYIAKEYGVGNCAIYNIKTNRSWKNILEEVS